MIIFNLNYPLHNICWSGQNKWVKNLLLLMTGVLVLAVVAIAPRFWKKV